MSLQYVRSLRAALALTAAGTLGVMSAPRSATAQGPTGSYQGSCRRESVGRGGVLHAECRTRDGTWQRTDIRLSDCQGRDIENDNGRLVCRDRSDGRGRSGRVGREHGRHRGRGRDRDRDRDRGDRDYGAGYGGNQIGVTLFAGTRYTGRSMYIDGDYANLGNTGFNDATSSVRIEGGGTWRLCSDKNYSGRCVNVTSSVPNLDRLGMGNNISSIRRVQ